MFKNKSKGFTIIELIVAIAIIAVLAAIVLAGVNQYDKRARDARRIADINQVVKALRVYYSENGRYPDDDNDCSGWDIGNQTWNFFSNGVLNGIINNPPEDPIATGCGPGLSKGFWYIKVNTGSYAGCYTNPPNLPGSPFYLLGITNSTFETITGVYPGSPSLDPALNSCLAASIKNSFQWLTGSYE